MAHRWHWPSWVTGLVLLALGTSLPELFVCIASAPEYPGLAMGNIFGSNAFNVGMVLGLVLVLKGRVRLQTESVRLVTVLPLALCSLAVFALPSLPLDRYGWTLLFLVGYLAMVLLSVRGKEPMHVHDDAAPAKDWKVGPAAALTLLGFALLSFSSDFFLDGALSLADHFGWKEGFAGFILTAVGTSAPELFTSVRALRLGHAGAVFGNVIGSNAFNLMIAGALVGPLATVEVPSVGLAAQLWSNLAFTAVLVIPLAFRMRPGATPVVLHRATGVMLMAGYLVAAWAIQ